jgi:hypothetical protein
MIAVPEEVYLQLTTLIHKKPSNIHPPWTLTEFLLIQIEPIFI